MYDPPGQHGHRGGHRHSTNTHPTPGTPVYVAHPMQASGHRVVVVPPHTTGNTSPSWHGVVVVKQRVSLSGGQTCGGTGLHGAAHVVATLTHRFVPGDHCHVVAPVHPGAAVVVPRAAHRAL